MGKEYLLRLRTEGCILLHECAAHCAVIRFRPYSWLLNTRESGADAIGVAGVVVVHVAIVVDIPEVGGVAHIRRTQPPVGGGIEYNHCIETVLFERLETLSVRLL